MLSDIFLRPYTPEDHEDTLYSRYEKSGLFNPDICIKKGVTAKDAPPFSIVLPPPNVTGVLHMGHAAMLALEDILVRFNRMRGRRTLWVPGTDHAAIATQAKVESELYKKEKKNKHDYGREVFLEKVDTFAKESHDSIVNQIKKMGASVDWSREAFTLDETRSSAVRYAFKKMYDEGLIYRGARIVNWDPKLQTTVSDDEVERVEKKGEFYYLKYGPFTIGTARPETKFGDKYVVMHPRDTRYTSYKHGQKIELEWINGPITATIIKDAAVDMDFGTGVMTITPWHDATDFEIAERHGLEKEQVIDFNGKLLPIAGEFSGEHISKARARIVEKLQTKGLVEKIDNTYVHHVALSERSGGVIEPQIKEQWFIDVEKEFTLPHSQIDGIKSGSSTTLKDLMRHVVESQQIKIAPERFEKIYFHWIENLRPWCISRQIWYGHRIPAWHHDNKCIPIPGRESEVSKCKMMIISEEKPICEHCSAEYTQDPDTLDTWFSSGLWTFSTLGWPNETEDLKMYHPTTVLETGYDILFFWVARMILMSGYFLGDIPFQNVYLHGLVRDEGGRKMSKSLGNIIDPLEMVKKFGADATRLSLIIGAAPGNDIKLSEEKVRGYKHYVNKIWNATRFVLSNIGEMEMKERPTLREQDTKWLAELETLSEKVTNDIETFKLYLAGEKLYHYFWHTFADVIIEESKKVLKEGSPEEKLSMRWTLLFILTTNLKLLHPFMPFITEAIWSLLPKNIAQPWKSEEFLMVEKWPVN